MYESLVKPPVSKRIKSGKVTLKAGEEVGQHVTENKEEIIIVLRGSVTLVKGTESIPLKTGDAHFVPEGTVHNVINKSTDEAVYVYVVSAL